MSQLQKLVDLELNLIPPYISGYFYASIDYNNKEKDLVEHLIITIDRLQFMQKMMRKVPFIPKCLLEEEALGYLIDNGLAYSDQDKYFLSERAIEGRYNLFTRADII